MSRLDKDRQQITFKISYTGAIIVSFALLVAMTLVYLVGKKMSRSPGLAVASQTSEQLRQTRTSGCAERQRAKRSEPKSAASSARGRHRHNIPPRR